MSTPTRPWRAFWHFSSRCGCTNAAPLALQALLLWALLLTAWPAAAGIVYVGVTSGRNEGLPTDGTPGALTIARPAGVGPGDALVASIAARPRSMTAVAPPGWVQMTFTDEPDGGSGTAPGGMTMITYYKVVTTAEPASYTWTFANPVNAGGNLVGAILAFTGIDTSTGNPIDNNGNAWSARINPYGLTHSTTSINTVTANTMVLSSISYLSSSSFSGPTGIAGITEIVDMSGPELPNAVGITMQMAIAARAATGATGATSATAGGDDDYGIGHLMALKPTLIDPALTMTRAAPLIAGGTASYGLTVKNRGVMPEPGPLTVVNTLGSGLTYTSASGSGWVCSASGQTVTCTRTGALAADASAPVLTVNANVGTGVSGVVSNSATVSGTGGDGNTQNNTAVNNYVIPTASYAYYAMDEVSWGSIADSSGNNRHATVLGSASATGLPVPTPPGAAITGATGTCAAGRVPAGTTAIGVNTGIDLNALGQQGTIAFWYAGSSAWNDGQDRMLLDASQDLGANDRHFFVAKRGSGVLTFSLKDSAGTVLTASTAANAYPANQWHHITVRWDVPGGTAKIYLDGGEVASASASLNGSLGDVATMYLGAQRMAGVTGTPAGYTANTANGYVDELRLYSGALDPLEIEAIADTTHSCGSGLHHIELRHASGTGLTCTPSTLTVVACQDASCATPYTGGVSGALGATSGAVSWPSGNSFSIASGSSSTTVALQVTSAGTAALIGSASAPTATGGTSCNFGAPSCTFTAADAGLLFDVPNHRAEASYSVSVTAVKRADNSASCTPAFASVSKNITFKCSYSNPATGTLPVRVGGAALNAANNAAAACDAGGRALSLAFDATGKATTTVQYADVGAMTVTATYTGSGSDAGLVISGSDGFTAAPYDFAVSGITASKIAAGSSFSATVTARNAAGATTPNFGRESPAEGATLGFVRTHPSGAGAVTGGFAGSTGSFSAGVASPAGLAYTEVGRGNVSALLASGSYLGTGMTLAGSSQGAMVWCANENGSCVLPSGSTATVYYGAVGKVAVQAGRSGSVACTNANFGDPVNGTAKSCYYVVSSGSNAGAAYAATFKPHHFDVAVTPGCGTFSYAGQNFAATVTARNAGGSTTQNYDGSANTSPNFALATVLADTPALTAGSLSGGSVAASAYSAGVAGASLSFGFVNKLTLPQTLVLRASDSDGVSSAGYTEGNTVLRSGRLRLANAFGRATTSLQLAVTAEYWGGSAWLLNGSDSCTTLAAANVALSNPRTAMGGASSATTSASVGNVSAGRASITLAAPSPAGSSLSLDLALNLGASATDASCNASHPASTGAAKPWLRSRNGSCAATDDRDPAARASFGIFSSETRRQIDARDMY